MLEVCRFSTHKAADRSANKAAAANRSADEAAWYYYFKVFERYFKVFETSEPYKHPNPTQFQQVCSCYFESSCYNFQRFIFVGVQYCDDCDCSAQLYLGEECVMKHSRRVLDCKCKCEFIMCEVVLHGKFEMLHVI